MQMWFRGFECHEVFMQDLSAVSPVFGIFHPYGGETHLMLNCGSATVAVR